MCELLGDIMVFAATLTLMTRKWLVRFPSSLVRRVLGCDRAEVPPKGSISLEIIVPNIIDLILHTHILCGLGVVPV